MSESQSEKLLKKLNDKDAEIERQRKHLRANERVESVTDKDGCVVVMVESVVFNRSSFRESQVSFKRKTFVVSPWAERTGDPIDVLVGEGIRKATYELRGER